MKQRRGDAGVSTAVRRFVLGALCGILGAAALHPASAEAQGIETPRIVEAASGRSITRGELVDALRAADFVLLGERHDNGAHHRLRGELIADLAEKHPAVVAEHLEGRVDFDMASANPAPLVLPNDRSVLLAALTAAGFDATGWRWPAHEPLFAAIAASGNPLYPGNVPRTTAQRIAREGQEAVPRALAAQLDRAPLDTAAAARLDAELLDSHCGQLNAARLPRLRLAQRARDAAMASQLLARTTRPAVLVAGNGHVRLDFGVPQLLRRERAGARIVALGLVESEKELADALGAGLYTHLWLTAPAERTDPCAGFVTPSST